MKCDAGHEHSTRQGSRSRLDAGLTPADVHHDVAEQRVAARAASRDWRRRSWPAWTRPCARAVQLRQLRGERGEPPLDFLAHRGDRSSSEPQEAIREASELLRGWSGGAGTRQVQDNFVSIHIILLHPRFTSGTLLPRQHQK